MKITIERLARVPSTQYCAKILAERGAPEGVVLVAGSQDSGRGRMGRQWISPEGGLWFTMILRPECRPADTSELTVLVAESVAAAISDMTGVKPEIKMPNDILIGGAKVCGILADMSVEGEKINYILLGVGINANACPDSLPADQPYEATSLKAETGAPVNLNKLLDTCVKALAKDLKQLT